MRPAKVPIISRSQIDARTYAAKVFAKISDDVTADLGGRDQLSAVEATLVESFAGIAVMLDDYNVRTLLGEKVDPYAYCQISSTLVRVASRGNDAGGFLFLGTLVAHLQLLDEADLGAVLAFADVPAKLRGLLKCQIARRAIPRRLCHPQQHDVAP
jgi:hypothetical protein